MKTLSKFETTSFGVTLDGEQIDHYSLKNAHGMSLGVMQYGATITKLSYGEIDLVLGFNNLSDYETSFDLPAPPYMGAVVGRVAGRIQNANAKLNDRTISLNKNHGNHHLHGGAVGWSRQKWSTVVIRETEEPYITLKLLDKESMDGYPCNVHAQVTYKLTRQNELLVHFQAYAEKDTFLNPTQHMYFNLHGNGGEVYAHQLQSDFSTFLELQPDGIPTGRILPIEGSPLHSMLEGTFPKGLDHTFPCAENQKFMVISPKSGIKMTVNTSAPAMHLYVGGNCFGQIQGKYAHEYTQESGFCVETQSYPDAPNHAHFPSIVLKKGHHFEQLTSYKFENT